MKLLADEGVDAAIVARLRSYGHDVVYVAELVFRLHRVAFGVLLVRLAGSFTVLSPGAVRIRPPL